MKKNKHSIGEVISVLSLIIFAIFCVFPILNIVAKAFTDPAVVADMSPFSIFPKKFSLDNFETLIKVPSFVRSFFVSIYITVVGVFLSTLLMVLAAYSLTRDELKGRKVFIFISILVMIVDPGIIPEYLVIKSIGLFDSLWSVILFKTVNVYFLIILMRSFEKIPSSLYEAAKIDGATHFHLLFQFVVPLSKPVIAMIAMFTAVYRWNEFFRAMIYIESPSKIPFQVLLRRFVIMKDNASLMGYGELTDKYDVLNFQSLQAAVIIVGVVPILLLYPFILKYFTKGSMDGSVKE